LTVPSIAPLMKVLVSGLNATLLTAAVWPVSGLPMGSPDAAFHNLMAWSPLAVARTLGRADD
jgi:hypothetical protein